MSLNEIVEDIKILLPYDTIDLSQLVEIKKNLKTKFVSEFF